MEGRTILFLESVGRSLRSSLLSTSLEYAAQPVVYLSSSPSTNFSSSTCNLETLKQQHIQKLPNQTQPNPPKTKDVTPPQTPLRPPLSLHPRRQALRKTHRPNHHPRHRNRILQLLSLLYLYQATTDSEEEVGEGEREGG